MNNNIKIKLFIALVSLAASTAMSQQTEPAYWNFARTPVLGWNSWDIFGTTITEQEAKKQADAMAEYLKPAGYYLFTVDIQWYAPKTSGHKYEEGAALDMDQYSRLIPAVKKFPSADNGLGFKPLADYVHSKGLKFGIHLMRGIPRQAVRDNTPILGTKAHAADIANKNDTCPWNSDMYGVDMSKLGAQEYYDSLLQLYASWGVDFIKVDDLSSSYHAAEIEAIRKAIDKCGRKIIFSTSPGPTPVKDGDHVMRHANQWRISGDFWDNWRSLYEQIERLNKWTPYCGPGHFPDADMLPFGIIDFTRPTNFTKDEQFFCMSMWCIARSPLIFGGDMTKLDDFTLHLLTNPEVLFVNQKSENNRQISRKEDLIVWGASIPGTKNYYVGFFNAQDKKLAYDLKKTLYQSPVIRKDAVADINVSIKGATKLALIVTDANDGYFFDHASWIEPRLTGPKGTLKLTDLKWNTATAGDRSARVNLTHENHPIAFQGKTVDGIGTHANSIIEYDVPEGYDTFTAHGILSPDRSSQDGSVEFMVCLEDAKLNTPDRNNIMVSFSSLGFKGKAQVRDLWAQKNLGLFEEVFSQEIPLHGAGLYQIIPQP